MKSMRRLRSYIRLFRRYFPQSQQQQQQQQQVQQQAQQQVVQQVLQQVQQQQESAVPRAKALEAAGEGVIYGGFLSLLFYPYRGTVFN
ncbi:hypothetical protein ETH_00039790 [Eimeria tenella]|uniref:Uncharacterized protein n=1 Tax=Eimeria tenella TaxID=5802 RepID=U6KTN6_EIMTE|nr:hypothetical protein ETH_00039790 [Eimeria tenella]CDJ38865.1 hypothetical protein ETH_00039790 [Eimeria tenella]|eukprot:XP_013229620.1 hypothetical protein ETH_00039790 [Eimeria tenella]